VPNYTGNYIIKHYVVKTYEGMDEYFHVFLANTIFVGKPEGKEITWETGGKN
jgi:hypothetical protein